MNRLLLIAWVIVAASGCLSPLSRRLDRIGEQLEATNQQLAEVNDHLTECNQRLERIERETRKAAGVVDPQ